MVWPGFLIWGVDTVTSWQSKPSESCWFHKTESAPHGTFTYVPPPHAQHAPLTFICWPPLTRFRVKYPWVYCCTGNQVEDGRPASVPERHLPSLRKQKCMVERNSSAKKLGHSTHLQMRHLNSLAWAPGLEGPPTGRVIRRSYSTALPFTSPGCWEELMYVEKVRWRSYFTFIIAIINHSHETSLMPGVLIALSLLTASLCFVCFQFIYIFNSKHFQLLLAFDITLVSGVWHHG